LRGEVPISAKNHKTVGQIQNRLYSGSSVAGRTAHATVALPHPYFAWHFSDPHTTKEGPTLAVVLSAELTCRAP
jgi:hypothetical protein